MTDKDQNLQSWMQQNQSSAEEIEQIAQLEQRLNDAANNYQSAQMPQWDPSAIYSHRKEPWWRWQGLPVLSLSTSMAAVLMVLFKVEVSVTDDAFTLSFAGQQQQQKIEAIVDHRMNDFTQQQQVLLADYAKDLNTQQKLANAELVNHVLQSNRDERKEDFVELIQYLQQQREDDKYQMSRQLAKVKMDINAGYHQ